MTTVMVLPTATVKSSCNVNNGDEYEDGIIIRDKLRNLILEKWITLYTIKDKKGKYGRWLGIIYLNDQNINKLLLEQEKVKEYK